MSKQKNKMYTSTNKKIIKTSKNIKINKTNIKNIKITKNTKNKKITKITKPKKIIKIIKHKKITKSTQLKHKKTSKNQINHKKYHIINNDPKPMLNTMVPKVSPISNFKGKLNLKWYTKQEKNCLLVTLLAILNLSMITPVWWTTINVTKQHGWTFSYNSPTTMIQPTITSKQNILNWTIQPWLGITHPKWYKKRKKEINYTIDSIIGAITPKWYNMTKDKSLSPKWYPKK